MGSLQEPPRDAKETGKTMNNIKDSEFHVNSSWECIDPAVGSCLWELEVGKTTEDRRRELQAHMQLCDACRLDTALADRLEQGLQAGELVLPSAGRRVWWQRSATQASVGSALIAACLALLILLPPAPSGDFVQLRGESDKPHFISPVEGEVVVPSNTVMTWQPVDGATGYEVVLTDVAGGYRWIGTTRETQLNLPALAPVGQTLRAVLITMPADLVSPGRVSVSFSTGNWFHLVKDRLFKAPIWLNLFLAGGLFLLGLSLPSKLIRKKVI